MIEYDFKFVNEFGHEFRLSGKGELYPNIGNDEIDELERKLNIFMNHIGYNFNKDRIILKSVTDEEYEIAMDAVYDYRENKKKEEEK